MPARQEIHIRERRGSFELNDRAFLYRVVAIVSLIVALVFAGLIIWGFSSGNDLMTAVFVVCLAVACILAGRYWRNPDRLTASQTNRMLGLASDTLRFMRLGLTEESAEEVCKLLLPATDAESVAIYSNGELMGRAGHDEVWNAVGDPITNPNAPQKFEYGAKVNITTAEPERLQAIAPIEACISAPLIVQNRLIGTVKLYYSKHKNIDETTQATAIGFAELLSTQLALSELDAKTELATKMELRALQAQINPHFLFNTINTIASLIRTDPRQARILLREFATFYRRTLESSQDLITIELELTQTLRYLGFERARFGAEKIQMENYIEPGLEKLPVPAFIIQPIVENAVGHAMRPTGEPLHIDITVKRSGNDVVIAVADDGVGMESDQRTGAVKKGPSKGAGIALKNVNERLRSCFGEGSGISIESTLGVGTTVYLTLADAKVEAGEDGEDEGGQP